MKRSELIKKYIEFFEAKDHAKIPNSSLVPENDPTVLFTTAGMHPLVPFLSGQKHPLGKKLVGVQKCIRTRDIEEVGDTTHHTFFEMLGNWSLGDYTKKETIKFSYEFLIKILKLPKENLAVTVFEGNENAPRDTEAAETWKKEGIPKERIIFLDKKENWWGPAGEKGPCGPDTEIFYWKSEEKVPKIFDPKNKNWVEIWNNVLMEYEKTKEGKYIEAKQKNIDTGMGVERTIAILNKLEDNYEAEMWKPIIQEIEKLSNKKYLEHKKEMRIIADHIKAACFIINDGIVPSNTEQGYVLRRLIRRAIRYVRLIELNSFVEKIANKVILIYSDYNLNQKKIIQELIKEEFKFEKTINKGLRKFKKMSKDKLIDGKESFLLYQSYGFPLEMIEELAKEKNIKFDPEDFKKELKKHQKLSQTATEGKFKSGLADDSNSTTKLHTAAHMLLTTLQKILGPEIQQKGSNINSERLRFDFSFDRKPTKEEIEKIENLINKEIQKKQKVTREEMSPKQAKESGAKGIFDNKYGKIISVYTIGNFSKEICTGPHVENTKELGKFKIIKEKSSGAGVRRIKAILK